MRSVAVGVGTAYSYRSHLSCLIRGFFLRGLTRPAFNRSTRVSHGSAGGLRRSLPTCKRTVDDVIRNIHTGRVPNSSCHRVFQLVARYFWLTIHRIGRSHLRPLNEEDASSWAIGGFVACLPRPVGPFALDLPRLSLPPQATVHPRRRGGYVTIQ